MKYISIQKKGTAKVLCILFFISAALCAVMSGSGIGYKGIWQILLIICIVAVIQVTQRFILSGYEYIIDPDSEILSYNRLTVIQTQGKRRTSIFELSLREAVAIIPYLPLKILKEKYGTPSARMNFCADMFPSASYTVLFEINNELTAVRLQCDESFAKNIERRIGV